MNENNLIETSFYQISETDASVRRLAIAWLILGVGALGIAGIFAVLLVLSRTPGIQDFFPWVDFFRTALVVHVDQSVLIWFLAFAGVLWSLQASGLNGVRWLAWTLACAGTLTIAASPFLGAGDPLMNNYVPVLRHRLFFWGLGLFGIGIAIQLSIALRDFVILTASRAMNVAKVGLVTVSLATFIALVSLLWSYWDLPPQLEGRAYFEYLFWGFGHTIQFSYTQLMLIAWLWMAVATGMGPVLTARTTIVLLLLGVAPVVLVPFFHWNYPTVSAESRLAFIQLMQWGGGIAAVPIGAAIVWGLWRSPGAATADQPVRRALNMSILLFAVGGVLGVAIGGVNTVIPAHYHGSIVGVTLALMGLTYYLLPQLGFSAPVGWMASSQAVIYAVGQLLHVSGLAVSGAMGIQRKTAGAAQELDNLPAIAAMGVMGIGGLLAVLGGVLFVIVVIKAMLGNKNNR